ncbi:MAG: TusE/DsrC/DsvC family sulfur relay protein, partial [Sandaracinaceae bacterium]
DVQKGMSVMVELMRHVGRAVSVTMEKRSQATEDKKKRLEAVLGSKRSRKKAIGVERTPAPRPVAKAAPPPAAPGAVLDGVAFGADGHLADPSAWTPALGDKIAALAGVTLTDAHRKVIAFARSDFEATGMSPNIRRITQLLGVSTRDLYTLFPKAPGRTIAKIAGIPKPAGCL